MLWQVLSYKISNVDIKGFREDLIDFLDQDLHLWNELNQTLRHKNHTIVLTSICSFAYNVCQLLCYLRKCHRMLFDFFTNQDPVNSCLKGAFKGDMRSRSSHKSHEVVVTFAWECVNTKVTNTLRICFCSCIKTERNFNMFIFQITVNGFRTSNNSALGMMFLEIFSE